MDLVEVAVPAISAAGGGLTVGWLLRLGVQRYLKAHDAMEAALHSMLIQLTRIEERVSTLQRGEERAQTQERSIAIMQTQVAELKEDLNGVGRKLRSLEQQ